MANDKIIGEATALMTPTNVTDRPWVHVSVCDTIVPPAAESVIGECTYYYRPLHKEYANKDTLDGVRKWAEQYKWFNDNIAKELLGKREELIKADSTSPSWSRHANFMMRHIGCIHKPPPYYVSYRYYYCSTYGAKLSPKLSSEGKEWLNNTRRLLQTNMEDGLSQNNTGDEINIPCKRFPNRSFKMTCSQNQLEITPDKFKYFAFGTHVPAYLDGGLADLGISDWLSICGQPKVEDLATWETLKQVYGAGMGVGEDLVNKGVKAGGDLLDKGEKVLDQSIRKGSDLLNKALDTLTKPFK